MSLKFMPYMLATSVGGTPTTETMVSTLMMLFCSMLISPSVASSSSCTLLVRWRVVVVERGDVVAQRVETRLDLGRQPVGAEAGDIRHDAADAEQAVADLRGEIAVAADPAQHDAQIGVLARRAPCRPRSAGPARNIRCETCVELAADALEHVGEAVDDGLDQPDEGAGAAGMHAVGRPARSVKVANDRSAPRSAR